jgi:hypothetical protein
LIFTSSNRFGPTPHTGHFSGGAVPMWMNPQTMHFHFFTRHLNELYNRKNLSADYADFADYRKDKWFGLAHHPERRRMGNHALS